MSDALLVSSSPHIRSKGSTRMIMLDVIIALVPAIVAAVYFFGFYALALILITTATCVLTEWVMRLILKRKNTISDLSAVVTGILLAMNYPATLPIPLAIIGGVFAIAFVKELFGGLGQNFLNPAIGGRVFLFIAWPGYMAAYASPRADAITGPTPLAILKGMEGDGFALPSYLDQFLGNVGGCLGETSALAILIGAIYLIVRRVISPMVPLLIVATLSLMVWIFGDKTQAFNGDVLTHILSGGLMIGVFFMATDYVTSPVTKKGLIIYAIGLGLVTALIRLFTAYPEGISFAILLGNVFVPLIDRHTIPRSFGMQKPQKQAKPAKAAADSKEAPRA